MCRLLLLSLTRAGPALSLSLPQIVPAPPRTTVQRVAGAEQGGEGTLRSSGCWLCCSWAELHKSPELNRQAKSKLCRLCAVQTPSAPCWETPLGLGCSRGTEGGWGFTQTRLGSFLVWLMRILV